MDNEAQLIIESDIRETEREKRKEEELLDKE